MTERLPGRIETATNKEKAHAWAKLGLRVFPVREKDEWNENKTKLLEFKTPYLIRGLTDATTDPEAVEAWWTAKPNALVGVVTDNLLNVLDIDMNADKGKDGWNSLIDAGIEALPETFNYATNSGGEHYVYRHPEGITLGPVTNVTTPDGLVLDDIDRRAGRSYFIAWSNEVPTSLNELAESPAWLCLPSSVVSESPYSGSVADWLDSLNKGMTSEEVQAAKNRFPHGDFDHNELIKRQAELVRLGAEGKGGVANAIEMLRMRWLRDEFDTPEYAHEFDVSLAGAIRKFGGQKAVETPLTPEQLEDEVQKRAEQLYLEEKARTIAKRRLAAESFVGTEELTWEQMRQHKQTYLVDELVPEKGVIFLVAKRNIGKTFLYIDMMCRMAFGMPWLGKATTQTKVMVVIGEGLTGYIERLEAWCEFHGKDLEPDPLSRTP